MESKREKPKDWKPDLQAGNDTDLLTRDEVADWLGVNPKWVYSVDVPRTRVGRRVFYPRGSVRRWVLDTEKSKRVVADA